MLLALTAAGCASTNAPAIPALTRTSPGRLVVTGPDDAVVHVDGVAVARLPSPVPVELPSGEHLVAVTQEGYEPVARTILTRRGEETTLEVELGRTDQRVAAEVMIPIGAVGIATGIGLGVVAVVEQRRSSDLIQQARGLAEMSPDARTEYDVAIARKEDFRAASGVVVATGLSVFLVGCGLYVFDEPSTPGAPTAEDSIRVVPVVGPDGGGLWSTVRF